VGGIKNDKAYYIYDKPAWQRFTDMLHLSDKVIVLLGATGQGKTSVFKALANLSHDSVLPIASGANSSLHPIIARMGHYADGTGEQRSIYVIDMPGHGSAAQVTHPSFAVSNSFDEMYGLIGGHVLCALFVQRELVSDLTRTYFHRVAQHGFRLIRVLNRGAHMPNSDWSKRQAHICSTLQHDNCHSADDLTCTAITSREYDEEFRKELNIKEINEFRQKLLKNELPGVSLCVSAAQLQATQRSWVNLTLLVTCVVLLPEIVLYRRSLTFARVIRQLVRKI
jgi:GTP-binding protein EngB required for normal cell division